MGKVVFLILFEFGIEVGARGILKTVVLLVPFGLTNPYFPTWSSSHAVTNWNGNREWAS